MSLNDAGSSNGYFYHNLRVAATRKNRFGGRTIATGFRDHHHIFLLSFPATLARNLTIIAKTKDTTMTRRSVGTLLLGLAILLGSANAFTYPERPDAKLLRHMDGHRGLQDEMESTKAPKRMKSDKRDNPTTTSPAPTPL
eukprot:scaffold12905_cov76-Amphora_coffeaeformis.AAC.1